jgi:ABC-type antimicrobial peptide transport system permease subunit
VLFRTFKRNPLRFSLTFLQLLFGSLAMTLALSPLLTPKNTRNEETFFINSGFVEEESSILSSIFKPEDTEALKALAPDVEDLALYQRGGIESELVYQGKRFAFNLGATVTVDLKYLELSPLTLTRGSAFSRADAENKESVVLISDAAAKKIFGDVDPIGQSVLKVPSRNFYMQDFATSEPVTYRVVGTFADAKNALHTTPGIFFPAWAPERFFGGGLESTQLLVKAKPGRAETAKEQILTAARQVYKDDSMLSSSEPGKDFFISNFADFMRGEVPFNPNLIILSLFGIISLLIGSIGLFSTMLVEVLGRSYDIGVKRALGASRLDICKEFATEAATLALLGSVAGVTLSALVISQLSEPLGETFFYGLRFVWQPLAALLVLGVAVSLGGLLGFFPALRATLAKPVEALRSI